MKKASVLATPARIVFRSFAIKTKTTTTTTIRTATPSAAGMMMAMKRSFSKSSTSTTSTTQAAAETPSDAAMFDDNFVVSPRFTVHSIFRNSMDHKVKILPHGLEWDMGGDSLVAYVPLVVPSSFEIDENVNDVEDGTNSSEVKSDVDEANTSKTTTATSNSSSSSNNNIANSSSSSTDMLIRFYKKYQSDLLVDTPTIRRAIVDAHNRFCFAKDLPFKSVEDIQSLTLPTIDGVPSNPATANRRHSNNNNDTNRLHYYVEWKDVDPSVRYTETPSLSMQSHHDTIEKDPSATGEIPPSEVWLNGYYVGLLSPDTVDDIMSKINSCQSLRLSVKKSYTTTLPLAALSTSSSHNNDDDDNNDSLVLRSDNNNSESSVDGQLQQQEEKKEESTGHSGMVVAEHLSTAEKTERQLQQRRTRIIRVERKFRGGIRGYDVFDHMLDNLYALENVEVLKDDDKVTTYIGTATVADWIMGGDLTSRLWVQKDKVKGDIQFYRPLYNDDISTTDRRYRLIKSHKQNDGQDMENIDESDDSDSYDELYRKTFPKVDDGNDNAKIDIVDAELDRIRYLAGLPLPYPELGQGEPAPEKTPRELQHRRNRRRYFGM